LAARVNARGRVKISADDIVFFNGLGDAIHKVYTLLAPQARVIGPSPSYSTHSSAEAAHAGSNPIVYHLNVHNGWMPDLDELRNKVKYNENIAGIMIINPDNPTGAVFPPAVIREMVAIARQYNLFIVADEIYQNWCTTKRLPSRCGPGRGRADDFAQGHFQGVSLARRALRLDGSVQSREASDVPAVCALDPRRQDARGLLHDTAPDDHSPCI
jgi:aspartate/methionine/tyrosine aminotransferase